MPIPKHLDEAAGRLEGAAVRIERARAEPTSLESLREWLDAVTEYAEALSELHRFTNESVHEKLHELAARLNVEDVLRGTESPPPPS